MLTHCLPPAVLCLHCQTDAELNQQSPIVCMGNGSLSRSSVASGGTDGLRVPGQVVIPRMWGCLRGVLPGAEWPLNAPHPHPQRAYRAWLLSLKTHPASLPLLLPLFMLSGWITGRPMPTNTPAGMHRNDYEMCQQMGQHLLQNCFLTEYECHYY